jgi:hypothetical protein
MGIIAEGGGSPRPEELRETFLNGVKNLNPQEVSELTKNLPPGKEAGPTLVKRVIARETEPNRKRVREFLRLPGRRRQVRRTP